MANPTSNFGWQMPTNTDLVKDLPADFEVFGQAVDTSLMDLKGGTTGQVLSKASNTDMDFTWVTSDDANAIQNTIVDAKGDLISASANDVPARLAAGTNGDNLVVDSGTSTGLRWQGNYAAGKNKIINGDFNIWQRGTSFTTAGAFTADRWQMTIGVSGSVTVSQQAFTAGAAPVAGYESQYFLRYASTNAVDARIFQAIEDVRTFANQTVTVSFWAKSAASDALANVSFRQSFGSGGSANVDTTSSSFTLTSSWARYSATLSIPSVSGKTIGANSYLRLTFDLKDSATYDFDLWGVQVEAGNVATAFQTATGTLQGELAACQRYYQRLVCASGETMGVGFADSTTSARITWFLPVPMRSTSTGFEQTGTATDYRVRRQGGGSVTCSSVPTIMANGIQTISVALPVASGLTAGEGLFGQSNATGAYFGISAEL